MNGRSKDIVLLLGAGASAEAGIPTSDQMIRKIEEFLVGDKEWRVFADLYNHVKSAIYYSAGLHGRFNDKVNYNIETLVNTLYELEKYEEHPLYPFIAAWNSRFEGLAKRGFSQVRKFRGQILKALKKWMCPENTSSGDYYRGLATLQRELNFPLPIFSLNYDLCVERLKDREFRVEAGFAGFGNEHVWDWERFEDMSANPPPQIVLYKLHGSVNWKRNDETKQLFSVEQVESVDAGRMEVIFGRDFKLEAADPYLFYAYEFRRYTLAAKLIVTVGYGFGDAHINKMLAQGLADDPHRQLLVVCNCGDGKKDKWTQLVRDQLEINEPAARQVTVYQGTAQQFMETPDLAKILLEKIPKDPDVPF